ncbi:phosphoribosylamine--glycine ligase [Gottschalkiaceae bacterium SANA]|nr:phosphoribosylamine--glycine ligase [Gottschalkiaceae bacterium SANA]
MKVLILGNGGREHAIAWKIAQSPQCSSLLVAPGNAGTKEIAENIDLNPTDVEAVVAYCHNKQVDLVVVGPEAPLVIGIVDRLEAEGIKAFGPKQAAAELEGSKSFSKRFMDRHFIPTAGYSEASSAAEVKAHLDEMSLPVVLKADGLAAGKGVYICFTQTEIEEALDDLFVKERFGESGKLVVIEEFMEGTEASLLCFCDGKHLFPMESAKDHKRIFDNDQGPNTGGMGCVSPNPEVTPAWMEQIEREILVPIELGFAAEPWDFKGILFIGLMLTSDGPKVLEFNVRLGDPETQSVLPRLKSDLLDLIVKTLDGNLHKSDFVWDPAVCVSVVAASKGYPLTSTKGCIIEGLEACSELVFHAGTKAEDGKLFTNGGRVLAVSALGNTLDKAYEKAYRAMDTIKFEGKQIRRDIGK